MIIYSEEDLEYYFNKKDEIKTLEIVEQICPNNYKIYSAVFHVILRGYKPKYHITSNTTNDFYNYVQVRNIFIRKMKNITIFNNLLNSI